MTMTRAFIAVLLTAVAADAAWARATVIPVTNAQFTTGQWYFDGKQSALAGNAAVTFVPAIRFSNRFSVLPTIQSDYKGTRSAEELAGGNTLFQDTWENGVGVKAVHAVTPKWTVRERAGFRMKWFRETTDETWNHGLYDYRVWNVGAETERKIGSSRSIALGYDFSLLRFPNYQSLESSQSADLAREFAGDRVLDADIHLFSLRGNTPLPGRVNAALQTYVSPRFYRSQTVVVRSGELTADKRQDTVAGGDLALQRAFATPHQTQLSVTLSGGYAALRSNQNHYDAQQTHFVANYYDYNQLATGLELGFAFGKTPSGPMTIDSGYRFSRRSYTNRPTQESDGTYNDDRLYVNETSFELGFSYPIAAHFHARASSVFGRSSSNNKYEQVYRYNYDNATYQVGFTYDY